MGNVQKTSLKELNTENSLINEFEASKRLGVSRITMIRLRERGEIGYFRIGTRILYAPSHLETFLLQVEHKPKKVR